MTDIVTIFNDYCNRNSLTYHYGKKSTLNIIDKGSLYSKDTNTIYFLHEFRKGIAEKNSTTSQIKSMLYTGKFFLVKNSDLDLQNYQEVGTLETSKYKVNIEPLLNTYETFINSFGCSDIEVLESDFIDVTDALDNNMDGLLVSYKVRVPQTFKFIPYVPEP